jgi:hypothetical protein
MLFPQIIIDMVRCYSSITAECDINKLGPPFTFYLSDNSKSNVYCKNLVYVDLKSAYPSISKIYFGKDSDFVKEIESKPNKFEKNKFIATTLKSASDTHENNYLIEYNIICKLITLGYIYTKFKEITIIEFIKDGAIIKYGYINSNLDQNQKQFLNFINDYGLIFHEDNIDSYIRINKTTILKSNTGLKLKGKYKNAPEYIVHIIDMFLNGNIYDTSLLNSIKYVYDDTFSKIIILSRMIDEINSFYSFNETFLNSFGDLSNLQSFNSKAYLIYILYPVLSLLRLNQKNI